MDIRNIIDRYRQQGRLEEITVPVSRPSSTAPPG